MRDGFADAAPSAGDDCDFALQTCGCAHCLVILLGTREWTLWTYRTIAKVAQVRHLTSARMLANTAVKEVYWRTKLWKRFVGFTTNSTSTASGKNPAALE